MKRLYRVQVEWCFYAMAEDEIDARLLFRDASDDADCFDAAKYADEADRATLDSEWRDSIPYGEKDDRTCEEILAADAAAAAERAAFAAHPVLPLEVTA